MWNATAYWENDVASVRLSYNWVEVGPARWQQRGRPDLRPVLRRGPRPARPVGQLHAVVAAVRPQLTFNVLNITNKNTRNYLAFPNVPGEIYEPGRTFLVGIRGTF